MPTLPPDLRISPSTEPARRITSPPANWSTSDCMIASALFEIPPTVSPAPPLVICVPSWKYIPLPGTGKRISPSTVRRQLGSETAVPMPTMPREELT